MMSSERRRFTRVPFKVEAEVTVNNVTYFSEGIDNLSIGGCLLAISADLDAGAECNLKFALSGTSTELCVRVEGQVVRCEQETVAIKFTKIEPDSLFHLRNIVRYNTSEADKVDQEIIDHPGLI